MNKNTIITIVLVGIILLIGVVAYTRDHDGKIGDDGITIDMGPATKEVSGEVNAKFEGDNVLKYSFSIPLDATSTMKNSVGSLIHVTDASSSLVSAFYFSYEGGRGYTAEEYIKEVIAKKVKAVSANSTTTIGDASAVQVSSDLTVWKVAAVKGGEFLVVAEYPKKEAMRAEAIVNSLKVQ